MALERDMPAEQITVGEYDLPDASADCPVSAGALSYLRHGIGAAHCQCARRGKSAILPSCLGVETISNGTAIRPPQLLIFRESRGM